MKSFLYCLFGFLILSNVVFNTFGQVGIGTTTPNTKAVLELNSPGNNQGFLVPRLTTAERTGMTGLSASEKGLLVFDTTTNKFYYWNATAWIVIEDSTGTDSQTLSFNPATGLLSITGGNGINLGGVTPGGSAGGDLTGTYPNPTITNNAIISAKILDGTIVANDVADGAITSAKVLDGTIASADILDGTVSSADILDGTVSSADITNATIATADVADGAVTDVKIASGITISKLSPSGTNGQVLTTVGGATTWATLPASGTGTVTNVATGTGLTGGPITTTGTIAIAANGVTAAELRSDAATDANRAVTTNHIRDGAVNSAKILDATIVVGDLADGSVTSAKILDGTIVSGDILDGTVSSTDILDGTISSTDILDGTISSTDILDGTVSSADITNATIATTDVADGAITDVKIASGITISKLSPAGTNGHVLTTVAGATTWAALPASGIGTVTSVATGTGLTGGPITGTGTISIAANGVTATELRSDAATDANRSVTTNHIRDGAINSAKILDGTIVVGDLADGSVTTAKVLDGTLATADLADGAVSSLKITDATIVNADVSSTAAVAVFKLAAGATGNVLTTPASGIPTWQAPADASATNEIQTLSITGTTLSISSGNSVTLPGSGSQDLGSVLSVGGDAKSGEAYNLKSITMNSASPGQGALNVNGSQYISFTPVSDSYDVKPDDYLIFATAAKPTDVILPKASDNRGRVLIIRAMGTSAGNRCVVVASDGIDGTGSSEDLYFVQDIAYSLTIVSTGTTWLTIDRAITPAGK